MISLSQSGQVTVFAVKGLEVHAGGPGDPTNFPASWENTGNFAYFAFREQSKGAEYRNNNNTLRENSRRPRTGKFRVSSGN